MLRDDKGREFKMKIDKTILRKKDPPVSTARVPEQVPVNGENPIHSVVVMMSAPIGAEITIDGKYAGSTPSTLRLPTGEHTISMSKEGFKIWQRVMMITPGGNITIEANLEKLP